MILDGIWDVIDENLGLFKLLIIGAVKKKNFI